MPELFPQQLKANFTPEQQDYYAQLQREEQKILNGQTVEELVAKNEPQILEKLVAIRQEMLNFVLTKKTREMTRQEDEEREKQSISIDEIERKQKAGEELTDRELKFLYRIDGFEVSLYSDKKDQERVKKICKQRNIKKDVSRVLGCDEDQISLTKEECLNGDDIVYHFGDLDLWNSIIIEGLQFPQSVGGFLCLSNLTTAKGLTLPQSIGKYLDLGSLTTAEGLILPQSIGEFLNLNSLTKVEGLDIPLGVKKVLLQAMPNSEIKKLRKKFPHVKVTKI